MENRVHSLRCLIRIYKQLHSFSKDRTSQRLNCEGAAQLPQPKTFQGAPAIQSWSMNSL